MRQPVHFVLTMSDPLAVLRLFHNRKDEVEVSLSDRKITFGGRHSFGFDEAVSIGEEKKEFSILEVWFILRYPTNHDFKEYSTKRKEAGLPTKPPGRADRRQILDLITSDSVRFSIFFAFTPLIDIEYH